MPIQLFVDTNILLSFYHYSKDELDEIKKLILLVKQKEIKLFITQQVVDEYRRNREIKLNDALKQINERIKYGEYPSFCKEFPGYAELEHTIKKVQSIHKELLDYTKNKIADKSLSADLVLAELFRSAEILSISSEIYERAKKRVILGNPPGKNGSYGDAINWEIILENSVWFDDLHLVANDKDYFSVLNQDIINPFLNLEYQENMIGDVTCYRSLTTFFKKKFPNIILAAEQEKEEIISNLISSHNFASTRINLKRLKKYSLYSNQQVKNVLSACFTNNQINWILGDEDIKEQIFDFYSYHLTNLDENVANEFLIAWSQAFPENEEVLEDEDELPF